jgi:hypothetical protein
MRLCAFANMCLLVAAASTTAQPISFEYAGQSSSQGVNVYADGLISISEVNPNTSLFSLTVSNVRSDHINDDDLFFHGTALVGPDDAVFNGLSIFDASSGDARSDLRFGEPKGLKGEMIDIDGQAIRIQDYFDGDDFELALGFRGKKGGDGIRGGEAVTFEYEVTGVSFSFLDDYYRSLEDYFAVARFKGVGAGGGDSSKTPGGGDTSQLLAAPLPSTTGLAFVGLTPFVVMSRRRR